MAGTGTTNAVPLSAASPINFDGNFAMVLDISVETQTVSGIALPGVAQLCKT
jgi:hypothetical protein